MAKKQLTNYKFYPGVIPPGYNLYPNAVQIIALNKTFLIDEMKAYIQFKVAEGLGIWTGYTYDESKCERDTEYILNAYIYDMTYGGNSLTYYVASRYYIQGVIRVNNSQVEVETHTYLNNIIATNILTNTTYTAYTTTPQATNLLAVEAEGITTFLSLSSIIPDVIDLGLGELPAPVAPNSTNGNLLPTAVDLLEANKRFILEETIAFIAYNVENNIAPYIFFTYNEIKCRRDISYVLEAYISDLKKGTNTETNFVASKYWEYGTPQVDGDREPEIEAHVFIKNLIENYIFENIPYTQKQIIVNQAIDLSKTPEDAAYTRITELSNTVTEVIEFGLDYLPTEISNKGYIKIPGFYKLKDFLLVTNTSRNTIMYNFADPDTSATVNYSEEFDEDFAGALFGNDKITTLVFDIDTSGMMVTDNIQIFVEGKEQAVRLNPIATDAMERMKVGIPQSMLDADFEYGLQPTKWQALAQMRNYPSIYEVPGSDIAVTNVTTDASGGGAGASLITVTTQSAHGLLASDPITIKALANTISGFSRAEGTFLVFAKTGENSFTYYAKAKVGTTPGQVLASTYTQLRKGGFYTGAAIGNPTFSVFSAGNSGTVTTKFITESGSTVIGFLGTPPPIGSPISGTGIGSGAQVSSVSGGGGLVASTSLTVKALVGDSSITVDSTTNLGVGLVIDRGNGRAVAITDVSGNVLSLSGALTVTIIGTNENYTGVTQDFTNGSGLGAVFTVSRSGASYSTSITNTGGGYAAGNVITINGSQLGGADITNDANITIVNASAINSVATLNNLSLTGGEGYSDTIGAITTVLPVGGLGCTLNTTTSSGSITAVAINNGGSGYSIGDTLRVDQTVGRVLTITFTPGSGTGYSSATNVTTTSGGGFGLTVDIVDDGLGGIQFISISNGGQGYAPGDVITVTGGNSDATFTVVLVSSLATVQVASVNSGGAILSVTTTGTPITALPVDFYSSFTVSEPTTAQIADGDTGISYSAIGTIQITFTSPHGLLPGNTITTQITSTGTGAQLAAGPFFVEQVPSSTTLRYTARSAGTIQNTLVGVVYGRPDSFFVHRPFDGGVQLGTASPAHGANAIRMSKKYIRYQSGKGVMYNTGALFAPSYDIRSMTSTGTAVGSTVTLTTDDTDHGCQVGGVIVITGVATSGYDGTYTVTSIINERVLTFTSNRILGSTTAELNSPCQMAIKNWHGSTIRAGIFDDQNGMFWQYDGITMAVVKRSSTFQLAGNIAINANSNTVVGTNTRFSDQLAAGDRIVIRGMTHVVTDVASQTLMYVSPDYRGVSNLTEAKITKTIDLVVPQENWNLDPLNGSGPSGYRIDVTKMQMIGIQHTWYGAGFIDFMLRGSDGNYVFAHRFRNSNFNPEAYMRTGNQPVRYEVINEGAKDKLAANIDALQDTIPLTNAYWFPTAGTVSIENELVRYTGNTGTTLTGCVRGTALTQFTAGSTRSFTGTSAGIHARNTGVVLVSNTITPIISHWGSAFMIDGQFDSDRGYIFNYAATAISAGADRVTAFLIRLAPSVSNAQVGDLGDRELLNRAQLLLSSISCTSDTVTGGGAIVIEGVLNPSNYPTDPTKITWTGLSSSAAGGQPSFAQIAAGGSVTWSGNITTSTATIQGAFTTTITAKSFNLATQSLTAISFSQINATVTAYSSTTFNTYRRALATNRTDFIIPTSQYTALLSTTPITVGDTVQDFFYIGGNRTITGITVDFLTIGITPYTRIIMNAAPAANSNQSSFDGSDNVNLTIINQHSLRFNSALSNARNDFLITTTQYGTVSIANADVLSNATYLTGSQGISSITTNYALVSGVRYVRIIMTGVANATSPAGAGQNQTVTVASAATNTYNRALNTTRSDFLITNAQFDTSGIQTSDVLSAVTYITGGQTISSITRSFINIGGVDHTRIVMSAVANSASPVNSGNDVTVTVRAANTAGTYVNTNFLFFDSATWLASGAAVGTRVDTAVNTQFPAGTSVTQITTRTFGVTTVYRVVFTQTSAGTLTAGNTITFKFGAQYALPGEQVFSFITNPGESADLSLEALKELTATAIGGRGTFPNGPDVLAINIYKVSGTATPANIILRWGEAQA